MTAAVKTVKPAILLLPSEAEVALPGAGRDWLDSIRNDAANEFIKNGLPTIHDEEWRYTDIRQLKRQQFNISKAVPDVSAALAKLPNNGLAQVVIVNGFFAPQCSSGTLPKGVTVSSLASRLDDDSLKGLLGSALPIDQHGFTRLNTAYCLDGAVIEITENTNIAQPIELIHVTTYQTTSNQTTGNQKKAMSLQDSAIVSHPRNLIIAGKFSKSHIIERSICIETATLSAPVPTKPTPTKSTTPYLNNSVTEIIALNGAQLDHYKVQQDASNAFHIGGVFVNQSRDSTVINHNAALGGILVRNDIHLNLLGAGSHGGMNGLVVGHGSQHVHNHTEVTHHVPHCTSDELYKTVLDDKSRAIFRGRIIVAKDAQKTSAEQNNNNLLLSANAEADSKPQLEIYADDVICSHGATIGQLDEKSLFYFQSRGIRKEDARRLLTFAFVNEVLERINLEPLQIELTKRFLGEFLPDTYQEVFSEGIT